MHIKNSRYAFRGLWYSGIPSISKTKADRRYLITIGIGSESKFPVLAKYPNHKRCEKYAVTLNDWRETLVKVMAHESEHMRLHAKGKRQREDKAERRGFRVLEKYRRERDKLLVTSEKGLAQASEGKLLEMHY